MNHVEPALLFDRVPAPKGAPFPEVHLVIDGDKLCAVDFGGFEARRERLLKKRYGGYTLVERSNPHGFSERMRAYLHGELDAIAELPVTLAGTPFQQSAWLALRSIPAGQTASYATQAARIGKPAAVRAIGAANGQNPVAIVLPCHRVIGSGGALTGFGGGIATKAWLLRHEGALLA